MSYEPIDFSSIDPKADRARWAALVAGVMQRVSRPTLAGELRRRGAAALAVAAALVLVVWGAALFSQTAAEGHETGGDSAYTLLAWAAGDEAPSATSIITTLGTPDE